MKAQKSLKEVIKEWSQPKVDNDSYDWKEGHEVKIFGVLHRCVKDRHGQYRYIKVKK